MSSIFQVTFGARLGNWRRWLTSGLLLAAFAVLLLWPVWQVLRAGFFGIPSAVEQGFTVRYLQAVFLDRALRAGLVNSLLIAVLVTVGCTLISVPLAVLSVKYEFPGKNLASGLLLLPLVLPPFVGAIGMRQVLGQFGALTSLTQALGLVEPDAPVHWLGFSRVLGIVLVESLSLYPIMYLNTAAALANLDPAMEQAAANLGAGRIAVFRRITLPLLRPGLFAGSTIVLIWSFTELGTPLMFDFYRVTPVQIFFRLTQVSGSPVPYALVVVMLLGSASLYVAGKFVLGGGQDVAVRGAAVQALPVRLSGLRGLAALMPFLLIITLALLPHLAVVLMSLSGVGSWYQSVLPRVWTLSHYANALTHDLTIPSVANSILFAGCSTVLDVLLGLLVAYAVVRARLPGRSIIDAMAMLPLAVPGLVMAFGYLAISFQLQSWFPQARWLRALIDVQENPMLLLVLAYATRRLPYMVRSVAAGLEQTPVDLELAAKNVGASGLMTLRRITVPLIGANLIAGALLVFSFALLEVSDSLILAQRASYWPITKAIYDLFQRLGDGLYIACALGTWGMLLLTLTILTASAFLGRRLGMIFRV